MTDTLFEQHSIKEIQDIEKKLRNDIEKKKEELRQMVGERYRDLMESADTITEMKDITKNARCCIEAMRTHCTLFQDRMQSSILESVKLKVSERRKQNENIYAIAALIKILMDAPIKIWSFIESEDYISALQLYLCARYTYSLLMSDPDYSSKGVLSYFTIVNKQWSSIRHFQHILLQKARDVLLLEKLNTEKIIGPLCCMAFLSDTTLEQILTEVLSTRKATVLNMFKPDKSAKVQICEVVEIIQDTLKMLHELFYSCSENEGIESDLLQKALTKIMAKDSCGPLALFDISGSPVFEYLSPDVVAFRPSLKIYSLSLSSDYLRTVCAEWIKSVNTDLQKTLHDLLAYVTSVKGLSLIREAVECQLPEGTDWSAICCHLLDGTFSVWDYFLSEAFTLRIKDIIDKHVQLTCDTYIENAVNTCDKLNNESHAYEFEKDISSYVWPEEKSDLSANHGWLPHHQRNLWSGGTLGMKACGLTPTIQTICTAVDNSLKSLLDDIASFMTKKKVQEYFISSGNFQESFSDHLSDNRDIYCHLTEFTNTCLTRLAGHIEKKLKLLEGTTEDSYSNKAIRLVFLGHLCSGLTKLCPHLVLCLSQDNSDLLSKSITSSIFNKSNTLWQGIKTMLLQLSDNAFRYWSNIIIADLKGKFNKELIVCSAAGILKTMLQWDKIEIQEESEEGNTVTSIVRIPQQVSVPLYNCLFQFCWGLNVIGGHTLNSHIKSEMRETFLNCLIEVYKQKVNEKWPTEALTPHLMQTQALQLLFDVQFITSLMNSKEVAASISTEVKEVTNSIVTDIDPFDMDVFSSHLQSNLKKALQKSLLLLGLIASPEQITHLSSTKLPASSQMEHSLMLMPSPSSRLPLLPLAVRDSSSSLIPTAPDASLSISPISEGSPLKTARSHSSSPNLNAAASDSISGIMKSSSSFYDRVTAMSSSWFGSS